MPGFHALAIWDAARRLGPSPRGISYRGRGRLAADGYAGAGGRPGVLVTTTGPGAMVGAAALAGAAHSYVPVVNVARRSPLADRRGHGGSTS